MGIEKMTFVEVSGPPHRLDDVLERCLLSGVFQPDYASRLSEYSVGTPALLRNPYGGVLLKLREVAGTLGVEPELLDCSGLTHGITGRDLLVEEGYAYLDKLQQEHGKEDKAPLSAEDAKQLSALYTKLRVCHDAYELRGYAVSFHGVFHVVGFVPTREKDRLLPLLNEVPDIQVQAAPAGDEVRLSPPVRLRNGWLSRPFEMFVQMYGSPSYNDIDPTPFVAFTYSLLFGIMFGDVGQGLCITLAGVFLTRRTGAALGGILTRIGVSSMLFGCLYGSVFGFEHLLDPLYHSLDFPEKPIEVMHPETTSAILIAAVALGAALILSVIVFNICVGIRHRDWERIVLSQNGVAGLVFYASVLFAAVGTIQGVQVLTLPFVLAFLALPLLIIFLREPIARYIHLGSGDRVIHRHRTLLESTRLQRVEDEIHHLFHTRFVSARFGRIPTDSYDKLHFYADEPFVLYPVKSEPEYIWCIYAMASGDKEQIDAIFNDLYFERIFIPEEELATTQRAEAYIRACIDGCSTPDTPSETLPAAPARKSLRRQIFPDGIGAFFTESFFELFEVLLSFVTNTMSFLRVGGFILSHAGMMSVVFTLSQMVGSGASPVVIVVGNLFVMGLEGLIVGIQALRLEFYELFSRFYDAEGQVFTPVRLSPEPHSG